METNFTIPVNEAFEECRDKPECGCPLCLLYRKLENDELELILGASMMEPDIRIQTNKEGFCGKHYAKMLGRKNRLAMALTMESHLNELFSEIKDGGILSIPGEKPKKRIENLEKTCYVCRRIETNFSHMADTVVFLWERDEEFQKKLQAQPYFCLPHYRALLEVASRRLNKKNRKDFDEQVSHIVEDYMMHLQEDVSWFCKKFDYRYDKEPWYNAKDSVERAVHFLRTDT